MDMTIRSATSADDPTVRDLLDGAHLSPASVGTGRTSFFLAEAGGNVVGTAGLETFGADALLRSVAVPEHWRNRGIGAALVDAVIDAARRSRMRRMFLLTETADVFFSRRGFTPAPRHATGNRALEESEQFASACPTSAVCMVMVLR